ncbi:MAG: SIMPL domain-containing protein [Anaerolineae bacterium]
MTVKRFPKWMTVMISAGALLLVAVAATGCAAGAGAGAPNEQQKTISVTGFGEASAAPDVAYVDLGISARGSELGTAVEDANTTMAAINQALAGMGIEEKDMQTSNFSVWVEEVYDREGQPTGQRIYHVDNTLRVTVRDVEAAGDVIGAALDAGANSVNGLSFGIDDPTTLQDAARVDAIADARRRAEQLAEGLGVRVGSPITISESFSSPAPSPRMFDVAMEAAAGAAPPISGGETTVSMQVYVTFELLP